LITNQSKIIARTWGRTIVLRNRFLSRAFGKIFFGLNNLDKKLLEYINYEDGYFIELGANDGITQSNTKHLELYKGWAGVLIEPSPRQFAKLKKSRSKRSHFFNCACVGFDFPKPNIELMYSNLMSVALEGANDIADPVAHAKAGESHSDKEEIYVFSAQARTLQSVLVEAKSPRLIDLLSLDVEGGELEVLRGIDFEHTNFKYIVLETRSINEIREFLNPMGYEEIAKLSHHDYIFRWIRI
jgi:FkbM family methyltransferase